MDAENLTRASFAPSLSPVVSPEPIPVPVRVWSAADWVAIQRGFRSRGMDDRWHAFVERDRLFLHRSWTGVGIYEAQFAGGEDGWRIVEAVVAGRASSYRRGGDAYETSFLAWVICGVLLGRWDDDLWQIVRSNR